MCSKSTGIVSILVPMDVAIALQATDLDRGVFQMQLCRMLATDQLSYHFDPRSSSTQGGDRFTCQLSNRALQAVFRGRASDGRSRESIVERCDVSVQDQLDKVECRLVVKLFCKHANQGWRIDSRMLREYVEFFGPKTEQLDIVATDLKASFISYTEKISDGKDFEDFHMQENMHITISVKDFKSIVTHAETLRTPISCRFSLPRRPLQFSYHNFGIHSEFTLMTTGSAEITPTPRFLSTRDMFSQPSLASNHTVSSHARSDMPPPARPGIKKSSLGTRQQPVLASRVDFDQNPDSLFVPGDDEDRPWDTPNYDEQDGEEMLGWDASNDNSSVSFHPAFRDSPSAQPDRRQLQDGDTMPSQEGLEPTQRLSQLHGMFD
nr:dna repair protein rad9 [Quercus suber]